MNPTYLCYPSFFKYTNMEILLILLDIDRTIENPLVPPSKYFAEMTCNTEDRLQRLKSISRKEKIRKELTLNMLKAIPDIVVFQKYTVGDTLTISVNILNTYETSKPIRVILPPSTVFALTCPSGIITTKVAPGMAYQVNVSFFAHEQKDYRHYLTVISEGESFFIPIICLSHRPLLDIPDQINLPPTPVKTPSERFIIVRNLGEISAAFNIMCSPGFSAYPTRGSINAHDYMQLEVKFVADVIGDHRGRLVLTYETGEKLTVSLKASTYESNVYLEMDALKFLDTYITLRRKMFVKLFNRSKHIVRYAWKKFKTPEMDRLENLKYEEGFKRIQELETKKVTHLMHEGIIAGGDAHDVIYERIYQDELKEYRASDPLLYADSNWSVEPLKGEVWPDNFTIFLLTFSPSEAKYYNTILYLEVSGKEERLPLKLCGTGKGPSLDINVCELDANDIFLCSKHQYEISVRNKGHIPGTIVFVPRPLMFGGTLSCNPAYNHLDPNRYASFVLCFTSNVQGMFVEEIEFKIQESKEDKKIIFRGNIVCPLLNFDVNEVNFGKVALGYPISTYINLINTTQVPIEYIAQFFNDGENPALSCSDYANEVVKPKIHSPKELTFQPEQFIVHPNFTCKGQLTLLPNVEGEWVKRLNIIMWGTAKYSISLPILYVCQIPDIICETQDIFMRGCFVNYTYTRSITIRNRNEHPGYFEFAPCDDEELSDIVFEPKPAEDFIEGYGVKEVELSIYTKHIGQSTLKVYISIFGGPKNLYLCTIRCNGQGPVITVPEVLYFEEIRTLKTITEMLKIVNDSPVPATIAVTHNKKSCCSVSDSCLILNPSESFDLEIKAYVRVPGHFSDKIIFTTEQGESQSCLVKVTAVGSSILCVPEIEPEIDIGTVLTHQTFVMHLKFTNMGRKHHKIIWNRLKRLKSFRDDPSLSPPSVFSIKPNVFELAPDQSIDCDLSGYGTHVGHFEEDFYCHAIIEGRKDYAVITSFIVIAQLARPMLKMSHVELNFRIDNGVDKTIAFLKDTMTIKNISGLAITTSIRTEDPFYLISPNSREQFIERHLENKDVFTFDVEFAPKAMRKECIVWNKELVFTYLGHPAQDKVPIRAEENFPSLEIQPITIDFDCLPNFFSTSAELIVKNVSPLPLTFQWEWIREKIEVDTIAHVPINVPTYTSEETINISSISEPTIPSEDNIPPLTGIEECEMECENLHRLLEIDVVRPPIMTAELINAPPAERAIISNVDRTPEYEEELQVILYQLIKHYDGSQLEIEALKCLPDLGDKCDHCCELFDLVPTYGYLGPYEAQMVSIEFCPHPNTSVTAVAHCHPSGGETEVLQLTGKSSNISFSIDSDVIEFGRQLFCEFCEQTMIIKNTGSAPLQIEPFQNKAPEAELAGSLPPPNWYNVNLSEFSRDYEIRVRYFPGLTKEFIQKFSLQIAYLPAYTFTIHGFGVLQQIFCALPRPSLNDEVTNFLSYRAIASITSSFLKDVKSLTQIDMKFKGDIPYNVREVLKSDDWVIISFNDDYPTIADIQMAVERCMVDIYVSANYSILYDHTIMRNMSIASNKLVAPPYLIDFGYVIKDTDVHYTAIIQNYGPSIANIRVVWSRKMATKLGLRAKLARNSLQVGASTELSVTFGPTTKIYSTKSCTVSEAIFILVSHGQKVPIEVRAYVTVPVVTMNEKCVNFNEITLGCCSRKDIILENTGFVPCQWESKIEMDQKYGTKSVFHSQTTSGILEVGQKRLLDLNFEPNKGGKFRAFLIIIIEQNPNNVMLRLKGCGVKPSLKISETKLEFPSTLPYTENIEIAFTIENISPTPIEFFFSDFDEEAITEDLIVTTLTEYYRSNSLYIPHKKPGEGFPAKIMEFYNNLLKSVRELFSAETESVSTSEMSDKTAKRKGSGGVKPLNSADKETPSSKPLEEMESLLKDQIRFLKRTSTSTCDINPQDPVGDAIEDALKKSRFKLPTDFKNGIFIIFHGAPQTDYVRAANRAGLVLKLPVISVDRLFFDALIRPATLAAIKIRQILDESYFSVASDTDLRAPPDYDEYDYLQRKIEVLLSGKKKKPTKRSGTKESKSERKTSATSKKSSKKSSKSDKEGKEKGKAKEKKESKTKKASVTTTTESTAGTGKTKVDKRPTLIGLSEELLYQIIESQLATYDRGVIIESLESMFVRRPLMLFNWLLKGIGNLHYIHCIIFSCTYNDYVIQIEKEKLQSDVDNTEDKAAKIQEIMDMNAEDYANLPLADKLLFKEEVISRRKEKSQKKHDELLHRIAEKQEKILKKKGKRSSKQGKLRSTSRLGLVEKDTKKAKKSKSGSHSKKSSKSSKITKSSKTSKGSKKDKKGKKKEKVKSQEHDMKKLFIDSENVIWEMLHILEYWDRQNGILTKPVPARTASQQSSRKSKSAQKSSASSKRSTDRKLEVVDGQEEVVKTYSPEELGHICYKGVPCWLIDNAHKGTDPFLAERIASYLQQTPQLLEAQGEIENSFLPKLEENNILLSVIRKPTVKREKVPAGVFALFDVDVTPPKLPIQEQTPTKPSKRRSFSKRSKYSTTSLDATSNISLKYSTTRGVIKVKEVPNESKLTSRNVIEPGSKYTYKIAFTPTCVGLYTVTFTIEIVGWPTIYYIECKGKCEVPGFNLRPSVMFEKVIDNREEGKIYDNCVYFLDEKSLDFGTDLLPLYKEVKEKTLETSTVFKLVNELSQTCEIEIFLTEDRISSGVFSLEPTILSIPPQESKDVFARAKPCLPGKFSGIALMLVKNNPEIYAVQLKSSAINVSVAFEPKYIEFERTTLNCRTKKTAQLMNLSPVPILWKVVDDDDILTTFKIRPLSSRIEAYSHQKIDFTFKPLDTVDIPNKYLRVLVYNAYHDFSIPLCTESIAISAEVINVYIECPKEINFGEIKGRMAHVYNYQILSKIKYTMDFVFTDVIPSTAENRAIRKLFQAYPQQLQLKYGKVANANIVFFPKHFVDFVNIPIFHCMVIDPATKNIVTSFDITATATAHFSRFKFCPVEEIDFGHQLLGCEKTEPIALENTGRFDFNYVITSFTKMMAEKNKKKKQKDKKGKKGKKGGKDKGKKTKSSSEKSKSTSKKTKSTEKSKSSKSTKSTKSSKKKESRKSKKGKRSPDKKPKPKPTKLNIGCFNIISSTGILEPGESVLVNVTTKPKKIGVFQEKILIFISECESAYKKGIEILLQVTGVLPKYNFGNIRDIFSEQYVVETMADFNCPEQINNNQIFVIAENTLHLNKVGINSVCETHIKVQSISVVTTSLAASLDDNINFSIHPNIATTEAYGYALFTITFKPTAIQAYECTLNLSYITADSTTSNSEGQFTITITGEGCVPEIAIIKPELDPRDNSCNLIFNPLLVGEVGESTIVIESICPIWCKVIAEITHDTTNMLSLFSDQIQVADFNSRKDLNKMNVDTSTSNNKIASHAIVKLEPYGKASLRVVFKPFDEVSTTALLKLRIINNPYEAYCVNIRIESFLEDIVINGLKAASFFNQNRPVHVVSRYELDLGYCTLKTIKNKRFTISNNSKVFTYRFQFPSFKKLKFSPTTGHLKPATSKQVLVTFFARSTINFVEEILQCTICKIQYVKQDNEPLSWDDRQNVVIWKPSSQASLIEPRNLSAPSSGRRVSRKSSLKLRKKSADDISSMRKSSTLLKTSSKKSITSLKKSATDTRKSKGDKSGGNVKEKTIESKPEPPYIELLETMRTIELLLSIAADYCAYKSSVSQITMEDTLMFEKRTATFEITNTSVMPLTLNWLVNMNECYPRRINVNGSGLVAGVDKHGRDSLANIVQPRLVQSAKHRPVYLTGNEKFVSGTCTPIESVRSSTIFSDDGSLTNRSRDSWHENDYMPFAVEPCTYTIPPLGTKEFKIIFSPIDVFEYLVHLYSTIPNLHPQDTDLEIVVEAKSLLPLYHFDIMPTNYLMRRPPLICGDLADDNTKVVEFDAVGLNIQHVRKFNVINPTGESFDFKWKPVQFMNNDISLFHCNTPDGSVAKGKMAESSFTFIPQRHGTFEAFYIFTIEKYNIDTTFLLSGVARNPCVFFSSSHLSLKGTLVNLEVTETVILQNNEGVPLDFDFKKTSLLNNDRTRKITVEPMSSTLKPNSKLPISLTFKASQTGEVDFRLKCNVEKMNKPLTLLVTTNVYDVELELVYLNGNKRLILDPKSVNTIELKSLVVLEKDSAHFQIINNGKIGFYYNWQCVEKCSEEYAVVKFDNADGYCLCSVETSTAVTIQPRRQLTQKRFKIMLQILYGPKYIIYFICTTAKASYKFSFNEYNFGNCLLQPEKTTYYSCILEFTNFDQQSITLEYNGEMDNNFSIAFKSKPIPPKEVEKIPIYFHPIEAGNYKFDFKFFINSKVDVVTVKGVGTPLIIELVDQEQKFINLGAVLAGKQVTKTVQVVNRSNCKIYAAFDLYNRLPIHSKPRRIVEPEYERKDVEKKPESKKGKKGKKDKKKGKKGSKGSKKSSKSSKTTKTSKSSKSSKSKKSKLSKSSKKSGTTKSSGSKGKKGKKDKQDKLPTPPEAHVETAKERMERLITESIEITPKKFIKMLPNSTCSFTITFSPKEKMVSFTRKMFYQVQDRTEPLCLIKGSSIAADYYLDKQKIAFGAVVKGCSTSLKFTLFNTGDIGGRYKWKFEKFEPSITIEPSEGYISPDMSVTFTAKYHPKAVLCSATARAKCNVEHYQKTLRMEFTGSCVKKPTAIATLKFSCPVRTQTFQEVTIDNTNSELWIVNPKIIGSDFAAQEVVNVPPVSKTSFQVKFSPTTMSKGQPHKATLHLVLPNGHCTIYNLEGIAQTPLAIDKIERDIYCKRQFNEAFEIQNWLKLPQQFKVITKNLKPNETKLILYKTTGNATIDVPASGKRQYNWGIFVMNVGKLNFQVIFQNETTEEYMFYEIILNVKQGGPLEEIKLKTCVRTPTVYKLKLENPLKKVVVFNISSNCDKLEYEKSIPLDPCAERIVDICFTPLLPGVTDANLEIMTNEMGVFLYHFNLQANDPLPEPPVIFKCPLGQSVTRKISLYNSCKTKADFRVKLQDRDIFSVDSETFSTQSGATLCLPVTFEPNILGNVQSSLTLTSQAIGQYTYPLIGTCTNPIPQGPIFVKLGGSTTLTFKNPFEEEKNFLLKAEPDVFQVKPIMETVYGRRTMKIIVSTFNAKCDIIDNRVIPYTGKLTITFADCPTPNLKWVFYLQSDIRRTPSAPNN